MDLDELFCHVTPLNRFGGEIRREADRFHIHTERNQYSVNWRVPADPADKGYLGCVASRRAPLEGETHLRGRDLKDGSFVLETWHAIMADIIAFEMAVS